MGMLRARWKEVLSAECLVLSKDGREVLSARCCALWNGKMVLACARGGDGCVMVGSIGGSTS